MREILFRGKSTGNGEWVYGVAFPHDNCGKVTMFRQNQGDGALEGLEVLPETVGQYTGVTDKNGKKIFEGDCFKMYCTGLPICLKTYCTGHPVYKHIVGYYPEHFAFMARCIEMNTVHYLSDYRPSAIEVIGNIHDNPELLEVEK